MKPQNWLFAAIVSLAAVVSAFGVTYVEDDTLPEVRDRVARISVMQGDVQIKRADSDEWEAAAANLPLVEGDVIATGEKARVELQFENDKFARIDENSYLKIVNLNYSGIALSLSQGSLQVSLLESPDKQDLDDEQVEVQEYFEVDAPQTTIAFLQPGSYRIDAGADTVRVTVPGEGEARIYSSQSGFTLGSVRTAVLALTGNYAGEWDTHAVFAATDRFDSWVSDREKVLTDRLANAYYDEYYDDDIYGAEDLNANGEWLHTPEYGYIWQPYSSVTSSYSNWSPYRYGQWRWVSPYGWVWVNDEPWGWATYHYGRWVYYHGRWAWTPYGYYRWGRSWWSPALVLMTVSYGYVSWCPLPYSYAYYNYNYHYWNNHHGGNHGGHHGGHNPTPNPTPTVNLPGRGTRGNPAPVDPAYDVDKTVVAIPTREFGNGARTFVRAPAQVAKSTIAVKPSADVDSMPVLPGRADTPATVAETVRVARPIAETPSMNTRASTGAAPRTESVPLDKTLRDRTILGGRTPVQPREPRDTVIQPVETSPIRPAPTRNTGAVTRPPVTRETVRPIETPGFNPGTAPTPVTRTQRDTPVPTAPTKVSPPARSEPAPTRSAPPARSTPAPTRSAPPVRSEPAPTRSSPPARSTPAPTRSAPPARSTPAPTRSSPPARSTPAPTRSSPPARSTPSPSKSSPPPAKSDSTPAPTRSRKG